MIKVLLDGFLVDEIKLGENPVTAEVEKLLREANKTIANITITPTIFPTTILISTLLS